MGSIFQTSKDAVSCRACGATHARPCEKPVNFGLCDACYTAFTWRNGWHKLDEQSFLELLAGQVALDINRAKRGVIGRCEAISSTPRGGHYQCASKAVRMAHGRRVCASHAKSTKNRFVGEPPTDPYRALANIIGELCAEDARFDAILRERLS